MDWTPRGTLWIADWGNQRYTELTPDSELVATYPAALSPRSLQWEGGFDADGYLSDAGVGGADRQPVYVRYEVSERGIVAVDTFPLPTAAAPSLVVTGDRGMLNLPVPFAPRPSWAFDGRGAIWEGTAERYAIAKRSLAGDTVLRLEAAVALLPVSVEDRAAARADLDDVLRNVGGSADQLDLSGIPATKPAYGRLRVDDRGRLWVPRTADSPPADGEPPLTIFDIFDADGRFVGQLTLDVLPNPPLAFADDRIAGVYRDAMNVEHVVVFRVSF